MLRSPNNRCSYFNYFLHLMYVKNTNKETNRKNLNNSKLNKWSRVRSTTNLFVSAVNNELEVSAKTFKVYWSFHDYVQFSWKHIKKNNTNNIINNKTRNDNMQNGNQSSIYQVWFYFNSYSNYVLIINILSNNFLLIYKTTTLELLEFHCHLHHLDPEKPILHVSATHLFTYMMKTYITFAHWCSV